MTGGTGKTGVFHSLRIKTIMVFAQKKRKIYIVSDLLGYAGFAVMP
jgi:hypothetical protein